MPYKAREVTTMKPDAQTLKADILTALDFLPLDNLKILAELVAVLRAKVKQPLRQTEIVHKEIETKTGFQQHSARIISPSLVHSEQINDFKMEIIMEPVNDRL